MLKGKITDYNKILKEILGTDDFIDDSRMPSPEEVAEFPDTSNLDKECGKKIDCMLKELGLYWLSYLSWCLFLLFILIICFCKCQDQNSHFLSNKYVQFYDVLSSSAVYNDCNWYDFPLIFTTVAWWRSLSSIAPAIIVSPKISSCGDKFMLVVMIVLFRSYLLSINWKIALTLLWILVDIKIYR